MTRIANEASNPNSHFPVMVLRKSKSMGTEYWKKARSRPMYSGECGGTKNALVFSDLNPLLRLSHSHGSAPTAAARTATAGFIRDRHPR